MEKMRKPFQGVSNIVRFNWHFYALSTVAILCVLWANYADKLPLFYTNIILFFIITPTLISLLVSYYVYDFSNLYKLDWLDDMVLIPNKKMLNVNAGFDETSVLLKEKYPHSELIVFDFYDPKKHTEVSIKRARNAYPPYPNTVSINTSKLPLPDDFIDIIFVTFSAHEIRNDAERIVFFKELHRILTKNGKIVVTEHLRDLPNFLAYNIGFLHFMPKKSWYETFEIAQFEIKKEQKITPFISTFTLKKKWNYTLK
jgi:ubiquinone/menaquinone biosynthesis C-methylase UbiE